VVVVVVVVLSIMAVGRHGVSYLHGGGGAWCECENIKNVCSSFFPPFLVSPHYRHTRVGLLHHGQAVLIGRNTC
jgi:hypothetical protein